MEDCWHEPIGSATCCRFCSVCISTKPKRLLAETPLDARSGVLSLLVFHVIQSRTNMQYQPVSVMVCATD